MQKDFRSRVYEIVKHIPEGKVMTYGQVAKLAGSPGASRAVGAAMKANPNKTAIPCHRVVGSDGAMHGYAFGGENIKIEILKREGVKFTGNNVDLNLSRFLS